MTIKRDISGVLAEHFPAVSGLRGSDLIHSYGRATHALLYSILYIPELIELDNSVLLSWNLPDDRAKHSFLSRVQLVSTGLERERLESSFNFVEVGYLFDGERRDTSDEEDEVLAEALASAWRGCLAIRFPHRKFVVETLSPAQTGSTAGIQFFERKTECRDGVS